MARRLARGTFSHSFRPFLRGSRLEASGGAFLIRVWVLTKGHGNQPSSSYFRTSFLERAAGATSVLAYAPRERWWTF